MGNQLVDGWDKFWGAVSTPGINTLLMVGGGAIMAFFLVKWFWQKSRGGGGGGNVMAGFPWWPMAVGLLLTAPTFLIPMVLRLVQALIKIVDQIMKFATTTLG